jgi:hypothetical protein
VRHSRFQAALLAIFLLCGLAACGDKPQTAFNEGHRGYVEFYLPEAGPEKESLGIDVQVYRIENGKREFLGMTQKWKNLAEPRRGLTVKVPSGNLTFVVAYGSAEAPVKLIVHDGTYHRVRIETTGLSSQQVIGATQQLSFGLKATPEPPR